MVHGVRGRVSGCGLQRTVVCVVEVKLVTDVTEQPRGRQLLHSLLILTDTARGRGKEGREGGREGGRVRERVKMREVRVDSQRD